jgi:hypothetical protein
MNILILAHKRIDNVNKLLDQTWYNYNVFINTNLNTDRKSINIMDGNVRIPAKQESSTENVINGITWFFEQVDSGLIIEDDLTLSNMAFQFSDYMLNKYRSAKGIYGINNFNPLGQTETYLTKNFMVWGFATWRDRWKKLTDCYNATKFPEWYSAADLQKKLFEFQKYRTYDYRFEATAWDNDGWFIQSGLNTVWHKIDGQAERCKYDYFKRLKLYDYLQVNEKVNYDKKAYRKFHPGILGKFKILIQNKSLISHFIK